MSRQIVFTDQAAKPPASYSQAVKAAGLVFVSGTAPHDPAIGAIKGSTVHRGGMMRRTILFVLAAQGIASACGAAELGDDCRPAVTAMEKSLLADHAAVITRAGVTTREVTFGGQSWTESDGLWRISPTTPQQAVAKFREGMAASTQFACAPLPDAVVDGVAAVVYTLRIEMRPGLGATGRVAIAKSSGLIVSSESDAVSKGAVGLDTHYRYDDIKAPM